MAAHGIAHVPRNLSKRLPTHELYYAQSYLNMTIVIAMAHLQRVVVGVDLGGAQRPLGSAPGVVGVRGGLELGAAVVQDVAVAEGEHAPLRRGERGETTSPAIWSMITWMMEI